MFLTVADLIMEPVSNSIESGASSIILNLEEDDNKYLITISDNGPGIPKDDVTDPFNGCMEKHPRRRVHLGLPLLIQTVNEAGGIIDIKSEEKTGTSLEIELPKNNIDCPPLGDITTMFQQILSFPGEYELIIIRGKKMKKQGDRASCKDRNCLNRYEISRNEMIDTLGTIESLGSRKLLKKYIASQEEENSKEQICQR